MTMQILSGNGSPEQTYARQQLAAAITAKGVETDPKAPFNVMAEKVGLIQQETYELQGDKIYEQQMFGAETVSPEPYKQNGPLWNLYKVMTDLLSDARFVNYGGILLAEYYKGYNTIELKNAGAGGAYFTCDGDFYTTDKTGGNAHVWHDGDNGMANRWVAYLFAAPDSDYTIPSYNLCPRSIHIGRSVGAVIDSQGGRLIEVVVTDGNTIRDLRMADNESWPASIVVRGMENHSSGSLLYLNLCPTVNAVVLGTKKISGGTLFSFKNNTDNSQLTYVGFPELTTLTGGTIFNIVYATKLSSIDFPKLKSVGNGYLFGYGSDSTSDSFRINLPVLEYAGNRQVLCAYNSSTLCFGPRVLSLPSLKNVYSLGFCSRRMDLLHLGCKGSPAETIEQHDQWTNVVELEIGDKEYIDKGLEPRWKPCQNINISGFPSLTAECIALKVLDRLGENTSGTVVKITLGTTLLNRILADETYAPYVQATRDKGYTIA